MPHTMKDRRVTDHYLDRRSGSDRREAYDLDYFGQGGAEQRAGKKRRQPNERRWQCVRVSEWSSVRKA